jgi:signal transduction histidine kinase
MGHDRDEGGLGIGLALARKIAEMHGGSVSVESAGQNRGSEFLVTLPLEQPAARLQTVS